MLTKYNKKLKRASKIHAKLRFQKKFRLVVFKSNKHLYVQLINDKEGKVIYSLSTLSVNLREKIQGKLNKEIAILLGNTFVENCPRNTLTDRIIFDKGSTQYCGIIKAFAEAVNLKENFNERLEENL